MLRDTDVFVTSSVVVVVVGWTSVTVWTGPDTVWTGPDTVVGCTLVTVWVGPGTLSV
jgi:hypothetical protein